MYLTNFDRFFSPLQWEIILTAARITHDLDLKAFAVGGIVRDAIVKASQNKGEKKTLNFPKDIDLVFDGAEEAGIKVAITLHKLYPESKLQIHEKFQTAELLWQDFAMDMATARRETYAYAGANPQVEATTLNEDLRRRDFTVNALAVQLDPQHGIKGEVIDCFKGLQDLANKKVRAIREGIFTEDPRRLFRAVRFAVRLNLEIAPETYLEIVETTKSGLHDAIGGARLRSELLYTLAEPRAGLMFELLQKLEILRCVHPDLRLPEDLSNSFGRQLRRSQYWVSILNRLETKNYAPIQLGTELLLSYLPNQIHAQIDLGLTPEQKMRHVKLLDLLAKLPKLANQPLKKSEIARTLQKFDTQTIILAGAKANAAQRRTLWSYVMHWQMIKSPLTGADLKQLGYSAGKQMGEILQRLRWATIDEDIKTREDAIALVKMLYQQS